MGDLGLGKGNMVDHGGTRKDTEGEEMGNVVNRRKGD